MANEAQKIQKVGRPCSRPLYIEYCTRNFKTRFDDSFGGDTFGEGSSKFPVCQFSGGLIVAKGLKKDDHWGGRLVRSRRYLRIFLTPLRASLFISIKACITLNLPVLAVSRTTDYRPEAEVERCWANADEISSPQGDRLKRHVRRSDSHCCSIGVSIDL